MEQIPEDIKNFISWVFMDLAMRPISKKNPKEPMVGVWNYAI